MKIAITGGAGFIGSSIAIDIKQKYPAYSVTVFDNLIRKGSELNIPDLEKVNIRFIQGDIRNKQELEQLGSFDCMIEASAEPSVLAGLNSSPEYIIDNNLTGAINCFNLCQQQNANLIFLSTSRVYPISLIEKANYVEEKTRFSFALNQTIKGISTKGISEQLSLEYARSFYGTTKLAAEYLIKEYEAFYNMKTAVTRFSVVAGARQMGKADQGVATLWMAKHYWKQKLSYIGYGGAGKQVRDILHIDDLLRLIDMQLHSINRFTGQIFNAGGGLNNSLSLIEMTELCQEITGNKIDIDAVSENRPADLKAYISDNTKIEQATGWTPQKGAKEVFRDIFTWINNNEQKLKPYLT